MISYDVHEFKCDKTNITLKMQEKLCLFCASKTLSILDVSFKSDQSNIGRTEALDVTLSDEPNSKTLSPDFVYSIILNYYKNYIINLCLTKTGYVWYDGFEIDLWEDITGISNRLKLNKKQVADMQAYVKSIGFWLIDPDYWTNFDSPILPFITIDDWLGLQKTKQKANEQTRTRRTKKNARS